MTSASPPATRDLYTAGSVTVPAAFLQSLFIAECLLPSRRFWLISAWVSDIAVVDNTARQFAAIDPTWPAASISLSAVLNTILAQGSEVVVVTNTSADNRDFIAKLEARGSPHGSRLRLIQQANLHEKGLLGERFMLDGSMNFTFHGVYINEEHLVYRTDPAAIAERRLVLEARWKDHL
jgi:hypothetical protein